MKKLIAVAAVVVVSFAAQSSVCGPVACKVTFVDVDGSLHRMVSWVYLT